MNNAKDSKGIKLIFGLGKSGMACARYFERIGQTYRIYDSRPIESQITEYKLQHCESAYFGDAPEILLSNIGEVIVSPGIPLTHPIILAAKDLGLSICGDIELFARECDKPIIAITGSNGKSTVTDLTTHLIASTGKLAQIGGNFGEPVLDFLPALAADIYVLELSSFQLDTTCSLSGHVAVLLNVSEDHMDRYDSFRDYQKSKLSIFKNSKSQICNFDDCFTYPTTIGTRTFGFSAESPSELDNQELNISARARFTSGEFELCIDSDVIITSDALRLVGKHNMTNILASLLAVIQVGIEIDEKLLDCLKGYSGLAHRFQLVTREKDLAVETDWINDSKATNVGATLAALTSLNNIKRHYLILIAGGDAKGSDLTPLNAAFADQVSELILLGKDAKRIADISQSIPKTFVKNMREAVASARSILNKLFSNLDKENSGLAISKVTVLLSPACASIDMFKNFEERGKIFEEAVRSIS